ncbi:CPBP family intramembrane glutamic endopeptidase [Christiangramia forsetii]|uniref:Metal-dependent membrane protease n=2 Tax=Christiangramia forsetii TaxID=411153 RepID=A0LXB0_CHRFK|nr:type II CAAX endopeptidase family protein [Christiangramia forsetii]GGG27706.1 protease [Christiangramia forsetii]CAL65005.1 metal-dependent membrane protease [Christiangramia forsetii KT0803]
MNSNIDGWQRVLLLIIPYFFIVGIFQFTGAMISGVDYTAASYTKTSYQQLIISCFNLLGHFVLLWIFVKYVDRERIIDLGFQLKNRLKDFHFGFLLGFGIILMGFLFLWGFDEINITGVNFDLTELFISIAVFAIVAIVEEALFRGYILRNLMLSMNKYLALVISAVIFAIMHGANPNISAFAIFQLFLAGGFLGLSYIYTKNLWFPIALHFSWNLVQTLIGFNVSGQDFYSIIELRINEANIWNGGNFGFETSVLSTVAQIIFIIWIYFYFRKESFEGNQLAE